MKKALIIATALVLFFVLLSPVVSLPQKELDIDYKDTSRFALDDTIPVDDAVTIGTLDNGLTYYIRENTRPENRAVLRLAVNAGSILEDESEQGIAHYVEHMAFNGTEHFEEHQLIDYLESIGMRFGPDINAHTGFDETVYKLSIPLDDPQMLETGFQVLEDWAHLVSFDPEEIDKERGVIIEEWRLGRGAQARMREEYFPVVFKDSRYAERLPIGKKEIIEDASRKTLTGYYDTWYRPDLMAIIAVGDFDKDTIEEKIRKQFSSLTMPENTEKRKLYAVPDHEETLYTVATDPEATNTVVELLYKHDTKDYVHVSDYRELVVRRLYNRMFNSRLDELTQTSDPPFIYASSSSVDMVRTKSVYDLACMVEEGGVERGLDALATEAARLKQYGFTEGELERAKQEMMSFYENAYREREKTESVTFANEYIRNYMTDEVIPGIEYEYSLYKQLSPGIGLEDVNDLAHSLITRENRVVLVTGPEKKDVPMPGKDELASILERADEKKLEPYQDEVSEKPLMESKPVPGSIVSEKKYPKLGVYEWRLSNGATVVLKPTDFKNDQMLMTAYSPGGTSTVPDKAYVSAQFAASIVVNSGVGEFSRVQLQKKLSGKNVQLGPYIGELVEGFSGNCSPEDAQTLFQLMHLYFTQPRKDETAYTSYMQRLKGYLQNRKARPEAHFQDALQIATSQGHYRRRPLSVELLEEVEMETAYEVYNERFSNAGDFTFFFTGAFSLEVMRNLVETYLATLPAKGGEESWEDRNIEFPATTVEKNVYKGMEPKSYVGIVFGGDFDWSRRRQYVLNSLTKVLDIKLREKIREEVGGTYGVRVNSSVSRYPQEEYRASIVFGCSPDRAHDLRDRVFEELSALRKEAPGEKYMEKVKEIQRRTYEVSLEKNNFWLNNLRHYFFYDMDPRKLLEYEELVENLSADDITRMAQEVFALDRYVQVMLFPEKQE
jgi:zinc protease